MLEHETGTIKEVQIYLALATSNYSSMMEVNYLVCVLIAYGAQGFQGFKLVNLIQHQAIVQGLIVEQGKA